MSQASPTMQHNNNNIVMLKWPYLKHNDRSFTNISRLQKWDVCMEGKPPNNAKSSRYLRYLQILYASGRRSECHTTHLNEGLKTIYRCLVLNMAALERPKPCNSSSGKHERLYKKLWQYMKYLYIDIFKSETAKGPDWKGCGLNHAATFA